MIGRHTFDSRPDLADALAGAVAADLIAGIKSKGKAALAVSGGSTPKLFFERLSARDDIDWPNVIVTLVDERWVDESSDRSNARLVATHLLKGPAHAANFVPLYTGGEEPGSGQIELANALQADIPTPFDAVVLGMGGDGHTASYFPGGDNLEAALQSSGPVVAMRAPGAGEPRVTLTLPYILQTAGLYLHIEGEEKSQVLTKAEGDGAVDDMPIRAVLRQSDKNLDIYWCP